MTSKNKKILIIDDEKINIIALAHFLKPKYQIIVAADGDAGIEAAEKHLPDLILLDVIMPEMNGFDVLAKLKKFEITKNIPVIFISGMNTNEDEERGISLGAVDYIFKPFKKSIVKARVETQLKLVEYTLLIDELKKQLDNDREMADY